MKKLWDGARSWEEAEKAWDGLAKKEAIERPIKRLRVLPDMPGITEETKRFLKVKSLRYLLFRKEGRVIWGHIFKHPFKYGFSYFKSVFKKKSYQRDQDFFFYGLNSDREFVEEAKKENTLIVVGFSYCQKPFECPSGRFSAECVADVKNNVCRQCDIGKCLHALPSNTIPLLIPTVHYIGDKMFEISHANPGKNLLFIITACEMTLEMFGDFGNMLNIKGIGVRLDGRICNTMKAFILSEEGIKPGLTVVTSQTQRRILELIQQLRSL